MKHDLEKTAMATSLVIAGLMLVGKLIAFGVTGSAAILSDAAESVVHILATGAAGWSLWFSRQAPCEKHPYGHGKIVYFSAGFEGAFILSAALFIIYAGVRALIVGPELRQLNVGLAITGALALVNLALGVFLVSVGKRRNSIILTANGRHVLTDMWTSMGVVAGVGLVWLTDMLWLDPVVAIFLGLNISRESYRLIHRAFDGLIDEADPEKSKLLLDCLEHAVRDELIAGYHQLRHRQSDKVMWVEVHILLPGQIPMKKAHRAATEVEERIRGRFGDFDVHVTTHIEPSTHGSAHPGGHAGLDDPYGSAQPVEEAGPFTAPAGEGVAHGESSPQTDAAQTQGESD
jgi:cation diffusion facilitator family transporter